MPPPTRNVVPHGLDEPARDGGDHERRDQRQEPHPGLQRRVAEDELQVLREQEQSALDIAKNASVIVTFAPAKLGLRKNLRFSIG